MVVVNGNCFTSSRVNFTTVLLGGRGGGKDDKRGGWDSYPFITFFHTRKDRCSEESGCESRNASNLRPTRT